MSRERGEASVKEIIEYLEKEHEFLFRVHGFKVVHTAVGGRYSTEPIVGVSNGILQLLFLTPAAPRLACYGVPYVGLHDETRENEYIFDKYWIDSVWFFCFIDGMLEGKTWRDVDFDALERSTWEKLESRLTEVEARFESERTMRHWMADYVRFLMRIRQIVRLPLREWLEENSAP